MAYLVTGGAGVLGSRIVRDLVKEGERVVVYSRSPEGGLLDQVLTKEERTSVIIAQGDITDLPFLMRTVRESSVEKIIHVASLLSTAANANPLLALKVICEGTLNVFETARILGLEKVVWASTAAVFGSPDRYAEEYVPNDAPHYPIGIYGACKDLNEDMAVQYFDRFGVDISAIRYCRIYGAGQARGISGAIFGQLILNPAVGKPGKVPYSDGPASWLYVDDAARAAVLASKVAKTKTRAFNISGDTRSVKEVADYVRKLLPEADITLLPGKTASCQKFETTPIREEIGFSPQWSVEQGVKEMINATRQLHGLPLVQRVNADEGGTNDL